MREMDSFLEASPLKKPMRSAASNRSQRLQTSARGRVLNLTQNEVDVNDSLNFDLQDKMQRINV